MKQKLDLVVFSDDWGRHPSSCQHLIRRLLPEQDIAWINTIGMRKPSLDWMTVTRGLEKLRGWLSPSRSHETTDESPSPFVLSPKMWPWFTHRHDRLLNRMLLSQSVNRILPAGTRSTVAVTTIPITADLVGRLNVARWVYYCVDDFGQWPGLDSRTMSDMESSLVSKVDTIVAASEALQSRIQQMGRSATVLTHGVDVEFWREPGVHPLRSDIEACTPPRIVFWGVVDRRLDVSFVKSLSERLDHGTILFIGPQQDPPSELTLLDRVSLVPPARFEELPTIARHADVLIMPYADLPVTRAMQPLKLKEYLATGKPVVTSDLPAVRPWADCLDMATGAEDFSDKVIARLAEGIPSEQARTRARRLAKESWEHKARAFRELVFGNATNGQPGDSSVRKPVPHQ